MPIALAPFSVLYGMATRVRLALYGAGVLAVQRVAAPVISVGNITAGGTGKTPLVEWLARAVAREGRRVCVLTRGYGRDDVRQRVVVSDGQNVCADVRASGDEPLLLAENLRGLAAVIADADRVAAARWALRELGSEVFILDDGFQHLRLARDLNIVTIDATMPWGGGHLLPRGRLREPRTGLARADCIVLTRAEHTPDLASLRAETAQLSGGRPVFVARTRTKHLHPLKAQNTDATMALDALPQPLLAFCAVGNPQAFFTHVRASGYQLQQTRAFADHHHYTQADVAALVNAATQSGARALVTTAKDAVKLRVFSFSLPCFVLEIALEFDEEAELMKLVRAAISAEPARNTMHG
ncbi:MAG: tetraacyldisaccharide 4'-kinase [Pyrinomonadaceae bacterium]